MFNTMTITKTAGALIGSLLSLLLLFWAGSALFHVGASEGHAEGEGHAQAYTIPVEDAGGGGEAAAEEQIDFGALLAAADPAKGEKVFGKCKACHKIDGSDGTGPHLNGVVGRPVASVSGFNYDDAMKEHAAEAPEWTPEALQAFLADPKGIVPGTKMSFAGLPKPEDRADLIAFLQTQN
ncbi:cytochrome c family protein [Paracoccus aurantiacus]|uniref:Cytochrome c family protein n=1 Tax=Paracoccus aurantiacus TaxID=2599412 RepID=A0A5C6S9I7_9RHOB|nr:cytochrome c family protein [Paracoccus aurantiacus]TXB71044.1 cytochrome c family protein [Paracoccus aurantiacus]